MLKRRPKKVWYRQEGYGYELFRVLSVVSPSPDDDFLILQREVVNPRNKENVYYIVLSVNVHEHPVYLDSSKVRALLADRRNSEKDYRMDIQTAEMNLKFLWLNILSGN
jgi:hypothetical protein